MLKKGMPLEVQGYIGSQLFNHAPTNIIVIDRDFKVVVANQRFTNVFGEAEGKYCYEVYKKRKTRCKNCLSADTFNDGTPRIHDSEGIDKNGRPAHYVVHVAPVYDNEGNIIYLIEMSYDVTESQFLQRQYNILFERVPCYISIINRDFRVVRANEMLRKTFGDEVGEHCYKMYKHRDAQCDNCPAQKTFSDGGYYTSKQVGINKNGDLTTYIVSTAPLSRSGDHFEHVVEMAIDVTEAEKLSEELIRQARFRHVLTESVLDALLASDASGTITLFNSAAEKLLGQPASEVIGHSKLSDLMPPEFDKAIAASTEGILLPDTTVTNDKWEEIPVRLSGTVLTEKEKIIGTSVFLQDLREYKKLERENLDNERLAAVGQTVAQLAHGIKNILTGLQGGMYVTRSGIKRGSTERTNKGWNMLERNIERITVLVKGFLGFSKGHIPEVKPTDPNKVAEDVFNLYKDAALKNGITMTYHPKEGIQKANMDQEDMHACLENLVSNALDSCQVSSENSEQTIAITVGEKDGVLFYEVADNGCGMDYEVKKKVFTTFFTTKGLGGTGLGLLVTRKIVQEHGGKISVESTPGKGSVFSIRLPRERLPALPEGSEPE